MTDLKYPVLLVHGMGFRDSRIIGYWGRIPKALQKEGCRIYFGNQDSNGTVEDNGRFLADQIRNIVTYSHHLSYRFEVGASRSTGLMV